MAGHSKWSKIKNSKGAADQQRGKVFQKFSKEIYVAAKSGGPDPSSNPALRLKIEKAKAANMPNDNINRAIKKASSAGEGENYEEVTYEGYGPNGVAVLVQALTDNRNRSATNIRVAFNKNGGSLGESGSVAYMFDRKGYIAIEREGLDVDEDTMLMSVLEAGGEELETSEEVFEIYTDPADLNDVRDALEAEGYKLAQAESTMVPQTMIDIDADKEELFKVMLEKLEDDDDVQEVYHNGNLTE
ncbi:YebC/PmpR family DNA-binding transcriptional regulator [Jeotgalibaca ciconiae]|uniref:Probable transcriptional regulatory protein EJN90_13090 n=1 Tax=Jeotgalibaca ciconiae TaxID=2496265 RepID=A0A3S9HDS0_9LACT|nr:YebC/PmpR family DNA-binding transcriptional regulator [Jeotgalibaca ciconiae]AZP05507.1 YebC/PmpR family DNA-binding transcriptional regulator [Jeotgalibaca ciconiae]HJB23694.1 YebC/PmpR family DNA-binding transcriptional regulator [Candidatus Jeotgalibaca pullicola]